MATNTPIEEVPSATTTSTEPATTPTTSTTDPATPTTSTTDPAAPTSSTPDSVPTPTAESVPATPPPPPYPSVLGVDFGSQKVVVSWTEPTTRIPIIVRNDISDLQTPAIIAFNGKQRLIGENARGRMGIHPESCVSNIATFLGKTDEEIRNIYTPFKVLPGPLFQLPYGESTISLSPTQAAAILFKRLAKYIDQAHPPEGESPARHCSIAVPGGYTAKQKSAVRDAARIAGFNVVAVVPEHAAVASLYALKRFYPAENKEGNGEGVGVKNVVFVDVGYSNSTVSLVRMEEGKAAVVTAVHKGVGGFDFDKRIFDYAAEVIKEKYSFDVKKAARYVVRLYAAAEKAKNTLSTIKETELVFATPDQDIKINISKAHFEQLCAPEISQLTDLANEFLSKEGVDKSTINTVEIIGGGSRIPIVSTVFENLLGLSLSHGLDSTLSVGLGAAAYASIITPGYNQFEFVDNTSTPLEEGGMTEADLAECIKIEEEMTLNDLTLERIAHQKNVLESFLFQMKDHLGDTKFADCFDVKVKEDFEQSLKQCTFWLEDNEGVEITAEEYTTKYNEVKENLTTLAPKLFEKLAEIEKEKARLAAEAAAAAPPASKKSDKPRTNKQKLEAATSKKEHGNKLFVDLDYVNAIRRYTQAVELLQSMFDETPEQKEEANKLKATCYLNIAGSFLKVKGWQKAIENAKLALEIEPDNAKALFRRGQAYYEIKEYELARDDLIKADKAMPNNKPILQLLATCKKEVTKRQEREKKMYSQMFAQQ